MAGKKRGKVKAKCLTCQNEVYSRGLCCACLRAAHSAVDRGETTEEELIENKLILPAKRRGPKPNNGFAKALARIRK